MNSKGDFLEAFSQSLYHRTSYHQKMGGRIRGTFYILLKLGASFFILALTLKYSLGLALSSAWLVFVAPEIYKIWSPLKDVRCSKCGDKIKKGSKYIITVGGLPLVSSRHTSSFGSLYISLSTYHQKCLKEILYSGVTSLTKFRKQEALLQVLTLSMVLVLLYLIFIPSILAYGIGRAKGLVDVFVFVNIWLMSLILIQVGMIKRTEKIRKLVKKQA